MNNLKIGVRAHDLKAHSLSDLFNSLEQNEIKFVQLAPSKLPFWEIKNNPLTNDFADMINHEFKNHDVQIPILGCYTNIVDSNIEYREINLKRFENYLKFSKKIPDSIVATETGSINPGGYSTSNFSETTFKKVVSSVQRLTNMAEKEDVDLAIEPGLNHPIYSIERTQRLLDLVSSPKLKLIFDPVNMLSGSTYSKQEELIHLFFEKFKDQIIAVHLKDFKLSHFRITETSFGKGQLNHQYLLNQIIEYVPKAFCSFEGIDPTEIKSTIDFFKHLLISNDEI